MKFIAISAFALISAVALATPAAALDGGDAYNQCKDTPGCDVYVNDAGNITIDGPAGGVVWCRSFTTPCEVVRHAERTVQPGSDPSAQITPKKQIIAPVFGSLTDSGGDTGPAPGPKAGSISINPSVLSNAPVF
jgi:hypothetical protein